MAATISPEQWLDFIRAEYLDSFVREGGASIKFAVPVQEDLRVTIEDGILNAAKDAGFVAVRVGAEQTRVHMIDQLFFQIAEQVPWRQLSERVNLKLAAKRGYPAPPDIGSEPLLLRLARANEIEPEFLMMEARRGIRTGVWDQRALSKEFRIAMTQLCLAEMSGGPEGEATYEVITDWLTGRNKAVSAVKPYQIFNRVTRNNARHLFVSLLHWIRFAGYPGLVVTLDISRLTLAKNPRDGFLFYSKAQMLDAYEVLRQFIDATDRMKGCLYVVMPTEDFLDLESTGRGMGAYSALRYRVYDEVHDQRLVNPMAALVRLRGREHLA